MVVLGGWAFLMSEVPLHRSLSLANETSHLASAQTEVVKREFFIDNLLVRTHFIIVMIRWTGLAPWEFEFQPKW